MIHAPSLMQVGSVPAPATVVATPAAAKPPPEAWTVPDPNALPDDIYGRTMRRGRNLIARTSSLTGPDAADPAMRFAEKSGAVSRSLSAAKTRSARWRSG